jgi:hypothetical protein
MAQNKEKRQDGAGEKKNTKRKKAQAQTQGRTKRKKKDPALPLEIRLFVCLVDSFVAPFVSSLFLFSAHTLPYRKGLASFLFLCIPYVLCSAEYFF